MVAALVALLPVTAFLLILLLFDSFKLVPRKTLARALVAGGIAALAALAFHTWLIPFTGFGPRRFVRIVAPFTEETLKALCIISPLRRAQIGFLVDAAIIGFGVGAGFALIENFDYLRSLTALRIWGWVARGFGTAIMHASATAIVAVTAKALADRYPTRGMSVLLPGWAIAVGLHATYNRALVSPLLAASVLLLVVPLVVIAVFRRSEALTREWVCEGLDLDVALLRLIRSSEFGSTRLGGYLAELKSRFPGPVVADMFCLLQLELELSIRAKGMLMAREAGFEIKPDEALRASLAERAYLQQTIGPTGLLALRPLQVTTHRDKWHRYLLKHAK